MELELHLKLLSDATFGRGDGVAGLVDQEVEHDPNLGLPFLRGRTLKGLLVEECANILYATGGLPAHSRLEAAAQFLFGQPGSTLVEEGFLHVGSAQLPAPLRQAVAADIEAKRLTPAAVLESLTDIRRQTAVEESGAPDEGSLRSMRVVLRHTEFIAPLRFQRPPSADALALLAACAAALRRAGTGRNRGRGRLETTLIHPTDEQFVTQQMKHFRGLVTQTAEETGEGVVSSEGVAT